MAWHKQLWLALLAILLAGCSTRGNSILPIAQYVLAERSTQPEVYTTGPWTMQFDYRFEAPGPGDSTGSLSVDSTLTINAPWVKRLRILISFVDTEGKVLEEVTFLEADDIPTTPLMTHHQFITPAGTTAIAFRGRTSGSMPLLD